MTIKEQIISVADAMSQLANRMICINDPEYQKHAEYLEDIAMHMRCYWTVYLEDDVVEK